MSPAPPRRIIPNPPSGWASWDALMEPALEQAHLAASLEEVPVGAVVVAANGTIIGRGHNQPVTLADPSAHAEILALRQAGATMGNYRLAGCVLVVTLEPCLMCTGAAVHARLNGIVFGAHDARAGAVCSCLDALALPFHNTEVWQLGGIAENTCAALLQHFFLNRRPAQL